MDITEPTLTCPYNKAHSIISSRMQFHLTKCRIQHPTNEKTICPFNSTHVIPHVEFSYHLAFCEDRIVLDAFTCKVGSSSTAKVELTKVEPLVIKSDENWDICCHIKICSARIVLDAFTCKVGSSCAPKVELVAEPVQITGDENWDVSDDPPVSVLERVHETSKTKPTLQALIGAPKSERKAFRNQERLRIQRVLDSKGMENKAGEGSGRKMEVGEGSGKKKVQDSKGRNEIFSDESEVASKNHNFNYSHNRAVMNANGGQKTNFENASAFQGSSRGAYRDPRNAWSSQKRNDIVRSTHFPKLMDKNEGGAGGPSRDARGAEGISAPKNSISDVKFQPSSPVRERDPGNPWKVSKLPSPTAKCTTDPGDFPMLPVASRGRGRDRVKAK